tara:strand:- start:34 stop:225 length:192 start_codon:yes stop_codon:yes gene_type:complete
MRPTKKEIIEDVRSNAYGFTNWITEINEEHSINMWDEIIEYFIEKRKCDLNYKGVKNVIHKRK